MMDIHTGNLICSEKNMERQFSSQFTVSPHHLCAEIGEEDQNIVITKERESTAQLTFYSYNVEVSEEDIDIDRRANLLREERQTERQLCSYVLKGRKG